MRRKSNSNSRINCSYKRSMVTQCTWYMFSLNTMSTCIILGIIAALCALCASVYDFECKCVLLRSFLKCVRVYRRHRSRWFCGENCIVVVVHAVLFHSSNFMSWGTVRRWFFLFRSGDNTVFHFSNISFLLGVEQDTCITRVTLWRKKITFFFQLPIWILHCSYFERDFFYR